MDEKTYSLAPGSRIGLGVLGLMLVGGAAVCGMAGFQGWGIKRPDDYLIIWSLASFFSLFGLGMLCQAQARLTLSTEGLVLRRPLFPTRRLLLSELSGYSRQTTYNHGQKAEFILLHSKTGKIALKLGLMYESPDEIRAWLVNHLSELGVRAPRAQSPAPARPQTVERDEPIRMEFKVSALKLAFFAFAGAICLAMLVLMLYCLTLKEMGMAEKGGFLALGLLFATIVWFTLSAAFSRLVLSADEIYVVYFSGRRDSTLLTQVSGYEWGFVDYKGIPVAQQLILYGQDGKELRKITLHYRDSARIRAWVERHLTPFDPMRRENV